MKRIAIAFCLLLSVTLGVNAQTEVQNLYSNPASGVKVLDTIINTATVTMTSAAVKGSPNTTSIGVVFTKLIGTVAGVATLKGSFNNVDWFTTTAATYTVTDLASQTKVWEIAGSPYLYYRTEVVGSGTSTYTIRGQVMTRNPK